MLKRAWLVVSVGWAALIFWMASYEAGPIPLHVWILALGPLAAPWPLGWFVRYVVTGSPVKRPRVVPYRRP